MENCMWCNQEMDSSSKVFCQNCKQPYHKHCIDSEDRKNETGKHKCGKCNMEFTPLNCEKLFINCPSAPKSTRSKSHQSIRSRSSKSSKASKAELELKLLDDQHQLELRELQIKMELERTYLAKKAEILRNAEESHSEPENDIESEKNMSEMRVKNWQISTLKEQAAALTDSTTHKVIEKTTTDKLNKLENQAISKKIAEDNFEKLNLDDKNAVITEGLDKQAIVNIPKVPMNISKEALSARQNRDHLPIFDGSSRKWPTFHAAFVNSTKLCEYNHFENLMRLEKSLKKSAYTAVEGLLMFPSNVPITMKTLELYFGQPEFIIRDLIEDIKSQPSPKLDKAGTLIQFSISVNNAVQTMLCSGMKEHLWNPILIQDILDKLPTNMKYEWAEFKFSHTSTVNLEDFNKWLQQKSSVAARLLASAPLFNDCNKRNKKDGIFTHVEEKNCIVYKTCTNVVNCEEFQNKTYKERWEIVSDNKLCRVCLKRHRGKCNSTGCTEYGCEYRHHTLLHKRSHNDSEQVNSHLFDCDRKLFKILPIKLYNNGKSVETYAMLDDGSSVTLLENRLADVLGLRGNTQRLCLQWTAGKTREEQSRVVSVHISASNENGKRFLMENVRTVENLALPTQSIVMENISQRCHHLKGLPISSYYNESPGILIGLDNAKLLVPSRVRAGKETQPIAIKTPIGWVVFGVDQHAEAFNLHMCECNRDTELNDLVKQFLAINDSFITTPKQMISKEDEQVMSIMKSTILDKGGHYECRLLWNP